MPFSNNDPIKITVIHKTGPVIIDKSALVPQLPMPIPTPEHIQFANDLELDALYKIVKNETDNQRKFRHAGRDFHRSLEKFK